MRNGDPALSAAPLTFCVRRQSSINNRAALDSSVRTTEVSSYFQPRQDRLKDPVHRDVWGLRREFGHAELASPIAPRALISISLPMYMVTCARMQRLFRQDAVCRCFSRP